MDNSVEKKRRERKGEREELGDDLKGKRRRGRKKR